MRKMKDSGVEWIGEIPERWKTIKIKYIASLAGRIGWQGLTSDEYCDEGAYLITGVDFRNGKIEWDTCVHVPISRWEEAKQIQIQEGDLLITKDGTVGKVAIAENIPGETSLNSGVLLIRNNKDCDTRFLFWMIQSEVFWKWFSIINAGNSTIIHLYQNSFNNFSFPFPTLREQTEIAKYLDEKCSKIDAIIARQEEIIEKLQSFQSSLISETVRRGLHIEAEYKDTKYDYIGKIPCHWKIYRLRNIGTPQNGISKGAEYFGHGYPFVTYGDVYRNYSLPDCVSGLIDSTEKERELYSVRKGDIFFTRTSETIEEVGFSCVCEDTIDKACFAGFLIRVRPYGEILDTGYAKYYFRSNHLRYYLVKEMNLVTRASLGQDLLKSMPVLVPPIEEQKEIAQYLDKKCDQINTEIAKRTKIIEKLRDYKKSLIYEIVTGKKEV